MGVRGWASDMVNPCACRGRTIGTCSLDARGEGLSMPLARCRKRSEFGVKSDSSVPCT